MTGCGIVARQRVRSQRFPPAIEVAPDMASDASSVSPQAARRDPPAWELAAPPPAGDLAAALAFCRELAARHYENFTVATRLVPARLRQHLADVYAFARFADDLVDEAADPDTAARGLAAWRAELADCFAGCPRHPVFVALADTVRRTGLEPKPFFDLLDAFEEDRRFDAAGVAVRYADRAAVEAYCRRSADPVGRIVLALEGCRDAERVAMSDAICTGLQLVNFWQDIRRDRRAGRVYLPADDMRRHGVTADDLDRATAPAPLRGLVRDEVAWAREKFTAGAALAGSAPRALRPASMSDKDGLGREPGAILRRVQRELKEQGKAELAQRLD